MFVLCKTLVISYTFAVTAGDAVVASWKIICGFQAPVLISVLWEWISWCHLKIFGLCGEKNRQTVPNCGWFYCVVVTENTVPTLLFLVDTSLLAPSSLLDEGRWWHVNCCSRVCVSQVELHAWLIVQHTVFAPVLCPRHPCHLR